MSSLGIRSSKGFSLIEVMIASAILGISLVTLFSASAALRQNRRHQDEGRRVEDWLYRHSYEETFRNTAVSVGTETSTPSDPDALGGTLNDTFTTTTIPGLYLFVSKLSYTDSFQRPALYTISTLVYLP